MQFSQVLYFELTYQELHKKSKMIIIVYSIKKNNIIYIEKGYKPVIIE